VRRIVSSGASVESEIVISRRSPSLIRSTHCAACGR
jgi:hypothetical protein